MNENNNNSININNNLQQKRNSNDQQSMNQIQKYNNNNKYFNKSLYRRDRRNFLQRFGSVIVENQILEASEQPQHNDRSNSSNNELLYNLYV